VNRSLPSPGGNPVAHNHQQASEKSLDRVMKGWMRVHTPSGRRRKKHITKVEGANLRALVVAVAQDLHAKRAAA
jgi:hypothetical protein